MHCENLFCVYWSDDNCLLSEISLDIQGNCQSCIYVDVEDNLLGEKRKNMRMRFNDKNEYW